MWSFEDWSADSFMGQAELDLAGLEGLATGHPLDLVLPLYVVAKGGDRREQGLGAVKLQMWLAGSADSRRLVFGGWTPCWQARCILHACCV